MRTVGQILKEEREREKYTLEDIEKHTKIRKELLSALEEDDYSKLPPATFVRGFVKNYGKFLNLDTDKLLAIWRRGFEREKHPDVVLESFQNPVDKGKLRITPARVIKLTLVIIVLGFFTYLWVEYRSFVGSPNLVVTSPTDGESVDIPEVKVEGQTDPEVKVLVNNEEIGVDEQGHFSEEIKLSSSQNDVTIVATSKFGKSSRVNRTVFVRK